MICVYLSICYISAYIAEPAYYSMLLYVAVTNILELWELSQTYVP